MQYSPDEKKDNFLFSFGKMLLLVDKVNQILFSYFAGNFIFTNFRYKQFSSVNAACYGQ